MHPLALAVAGLFATSLAAAPVPKDKKVKDEDGILGSWAIDKFDAGGEKPPPDISKFRFVFSEKGVFRMEGGPQDKSEGAFKLDAEADPKALDITLDGKKMLGLYALDGDSLTLCIPDKPDSPRPAEVKADAKNRIAVVTFKRVADEKKDK